MNYILNALPTILGGGAVIVISLHAVYRSRRVCAVYRAEADAGHQQFQRELSAWAASHRPAEAPSNLVVELDLSDASDLPDLPSSADQARSLVSALSRHEQELGGAGLALTAATVERGVVRLTLSPIDRTGSAERVRRVAAAVNAAAPPLPPGVTAAHADVLAV